MILSPPPTSSKGEKKVLKLVFGIFVCECVSCVSCDFPFATSNWDTVSDYSLGRTEAAPSCAVTDSVLALQG